MPIRVYTKFVSSMSTDMDSARSPEWAFSFGAQHGRTLAGVGPAISWSPRMK